MNVLPIACRLFFALVLVALVVGPALAAGLSGVVHDATGGAVTGVEVVVMTPQRTVVATARTGADGRFQISAVPDGRYLVVARASGFRETMIAAEVKSSDETPITITMD